MGQPCRSQLWKQLPAPNQEFAAPPVNDGDLIETVLGLDGQLLHIFHLLDLHAIDPGVIRPSIEDCTGRSAGGYGPELSSVSVGHLGNL
jgi:hypothetical protein